MGARFAHSNENGFNGWVGAEVAFVGLFLLWGLYLSIAVSTASISLAFICCSLLPLRFPFIGSWLRADSRCAFGVQ